MAFFGSLLTELYLQLPTAIAVSRDHKPDQTDERQRIEDAGGFVMWAGKEEQVPSTSIVFRYLKLHHLDVCESIIESSHPSSLLEQGDVLIALKICGGKQLMAAYYVATQMQELIISLFIFMRCMMILCAWQTSKCRE